MRDPAVARRNMVEGQLRTNEVADPRLIEAIEAVPRERFVPERYRGVAYVDEDLEIAPGRYLMEPMVLARLLQAAEPKPEDVALEVGCGTGYAAVLLSHLVTTVVALECDPGLAAEADRLTTELGADNVAVVLGALAEGHPQQAPYDVILLSGAVPDLPETLTRQLAEGGRLLVVVRKPGQVGRATLVARRHGNLSRWVLFDAAVPPLPGFEAGPRFVF